MAQRETLPGLLLHFQVTLKGLDEVIVGVDEPDIDLVVTWQIAGGVLQDGLAVRALRQVRRLCERAEDVGGGRPEAAMAPAATSRGVSGVRSTSKSQCGT